MDECAKNRRALAAGFKDCQNLILALGDETRQLIFLTLLESEQCGLRVGEITARTHLSRPAVSHHLRILRDAQVITMRRRGTMNFYYLAADAAVWKQCKTLFERVYETVLRASRAGYPDFQSDDA